MTPTKEVFAQWSFLKFTLEWFIVLVTLATLVGSLFFALYAQIVVSPPAIRFTLVGLSVLVVGFGALAIHLLRSRFKLLRMLGIHAICDRDSEEGRLLPQYQRVEEHYVWVGLSAVNELARTEVQDLIFAKAKEGKKFTYILMDPCDPLRLTEQVHWERKDHRRFEDMKGNIETSLRELAKLSSDSDVSYLPFGRIPCFRVTLIDHDEIRLAHYDRAGCGFSGPFLVLRRGSGALNEKILFSWFKHFASTEQKNALIDHIYAKMVAQHCSGVTGDALAGEFLHGKAFSELRASFNRTFDWNITPDIAKLSVEHVEQKFGLK